MSKVPGKKSKANLRELTGDEYVQQHALLLREVEIVVSYSLKCTKCAAEENLISDEKGIHAIGKFVDKGWRHSVDKTKHPILCPKCVGVNLEQAKPAPAETVVEPIVVSEEY